MRRGHSDVGPLEAEQGQNGFSRNRPEGSGPAPGNCKIIRLCCFQPESVVTCHSKRWTQHAVLHQIQSRKHEIPLAAC